MAYNAPKIAPGGRLIQALPGMVPSTPAIPPNHREKPTKNPEPIGDLLPAALDKLAQLSQSPSEGLKKASEEKQRLAKRVRAKYITNGLTNQLRKLQSPLQKAYINSYFCAQVLEQEGTKLTGRYCKNRWCLICNRIRTAKLINEYNPQLQSLPDLHFVTLTRPNVKADVLRQEIKSLTECFRVIVNRDLRRAGVKIKAVRKLECTYNWKRDDYHPHFHIVISGKNEAELLRSTWLARNPTADIKANDVRPCDDRGGKELFKYFTKLLTNGRIHAQSLDVILTAMQKLRVFQPVGIKKVSEEIPDIISEEYTQIFSDNQNQYWAYRESEKFADWYNMETGEGLTEYTPSDWAKTLRAGDFSAPKALRSTWLDMDPAINKTE